MGTIQTLSPTEGTSWFCDKNGQWMVMKRTIFGIWGNGIRIHYKQGEFKKQQCRGFREDPRIVQNRAFWMGERGNQWLFRLPKFWEPPSICIQCIIELYQSSLSLIPWKQWINDGWAPYLWLSPHFFSKQRSNPFRRPKTSQLPILMMSRDIRRSEISISWQGTEVLHKPQTLKHGCCGQSDAARYTNHHSPYLAAESKH